MLPFTFMFLSKHFNLKTSEILFMQNVGPILTVKCFLAHQLLLSLMLVISTAINDFGIDGVIVIVRVTSFMKVCCRSKGKCLAVATTYVIIAMYIKTITVESIVINILIVRIHRCCGSKT